MGAVVGLVAITPAAGYASYGPAQFIGASAAAISAWAGAYKFANVLITNCVNARHEADGLAVSPPGETVLAAA